MALNNFIIKQLEAIHQAQQISTGLGQKRKNGKVKADSSIILDQFDGQFVFRNEKKKANTE
jgi:hypothetical protein